MKDNDTEPRPFLAHPFNCNNSSLTLFDQAVSEEVAAIAENSKKKQATIENEQREKRKIIDDVNSWVSSLLNVSYRFVEYRFFAKNFPEVDDLVTVEVKKVEDLGAYVTLLEFGEIEGMVPLSELSRRRIRCCTWLLQPHSGSHPSQVRWKACARWSCGDCVCHPCR